MRFMIACLAAVAAVAFAAPSFAQEAAAPTAKPKVGTTAYCNNLKSTSAKASCLKRVHASAAAKPAVPTPTRKAKATKKTTTESAAAPKETTAQLTPPAAPAPVQQAQPSTIIVPPLPQKTI